MTTTEKLLKNPNEISSAGTWAGLIYGEPGTGKSTLALSAPTPVMIDSDLGMRRVQKRFQVPSLPMNSYQKFLDLLRGDELKPFDTIVVDTLGKFVDRIGDWCMTQDPKNRKKGGGLSQQGYGAIKDEFARVVREVKGLDKYLIFVAHGREEKDGDVTKVRPDVSGSSGKELVKDLDFMGFVEMHGDTRTISFTPSERYYAKNSLSLPPYIEIPDPNKVGNTFIKKFIIERGEQRALEEAEENKKYDDLVANLLAQVETVVDEKTADEALATINMAPEIWDSTRVAKKHLADKVKAVGLEYDKAKKGFVKAAPQQAADPQVGVVAEATAPATVTSETVPVAENAFEKAKREKAEKLKNSTATAA